MRLTSVLTQDKAFGETFIQVNPGGLVYAQPGMGSHFRVVVDRPMTVSIPKATSGRYVLIRFEQDTVGYAVTFDGSVKSPPTIPTTPGAVTYVGFVYDELGASWDFLKVVLTASDIPDLSGVYLTLAAAAATYQPLNAKLTAISALANAVGALTNDGSGVFTYVVQAPSDATYVVATSNSTLSAERVGTSTTTILVDTGTAGQFKWNLAADTVIRTYLGLGNAYAANKAAAQADSTAATLGDLVADFNALLAKLRTAGLMTP